MKFCRLSRKQGTASDREGGKADGGGRDGMAFGSRALENG